MAEIRALGIPLIREKIISHVSDVDDLKNLSLLNSEWNSEAGKFLEVKTIVRLESFYISNFVEDMVNNGWSKKNIFLVYQSHWYESEDWNHLNLSGSLEEDLENLPKLAGFIIEVDVVFNKKTTHLEIFELLTICKIVERLSFQFEEWDSTEQLPRLEELFKSNPISFTNLKDLKISCQTSGGWDFCHQLILPIIPDCCTTIRLNDNRRNSRAEYSAPFLKALAQIPGKLEQFEKIAITKSTNQEIWKILAERDLPNLKSVTFSVEDEDLEMAQVFLEKYKNQLKNLNFRLWVLANEDWEIPEMKNLEELNLYWSHGCLANVLKFYLKGYESGKCLYPKLRKLIVYNCNGIFAMHQLLLCFSLFGRLGRQLTEVTATIWMEEEKFVKWYLEASEDYKRMFSELFPNAEIKVDYSVKSRSCFDEEILEN